METNFSLWHRQQETIAQGALTNSKHPHMHIFGVSPTHAVRSKDCYIWDVDNKRYLDYICGLGTNLVGYGNELVADYVEKFLRGGVSPSLPTPVEIQAVEELRAMLPMAERVKWLKSGSEACAAALIIARAYTGRALVYSDGYHGFNAEFTSLTPPAWGCPPTNNIEKLPPLDQVDLSNAAAVIVEPVITDWSNERKKYLYELHEKCQKAGCLLIFDEIITGFRFTQHFVSRWLNIEPDLVCLGKAVANGLPLSAVVGPKKIMDGNYFVSSTYAGDVISLSAAVKTMNLLKANQDYSIETLWDAGRRFKEAFNEIEPEIVRMDGYPTRGVFTGTAEAKALFFQEMATAGILFCNSWFINFHLAKHHGETLNIAKSVLTRIKTGQAKMRGAMPQSPFSARARS